MRLSQKNPVMQTTRLSRWFFFERPGFVLVFSFFIIFGVSSNGEANAILFNASAGGNGTDWDKFIPQNITINTGESVTWINPMQVAEPHTVTFIKDNDMIPPLFAPYRVPNNTEFTSAVPVPNVEPSIIPDGSNPNNKIVIVDNLRSSAPVSIDSTKTNVTYLQPNSNYTFTGEESYVNSGWMWPMGQSPAGAPPITSFTMTFVNPGTYYYMCVIHPWMSGSVTVN
jgi:plastocyanin